jgi:mannan endo-1,4-beta-mannosidase
MARLIPRIIAIAFTICISSLLIFSQTFTIDGRRLIDANGKEFVIKGINNPHIWFLGKAFNSLETISELNTNCIRIVWMTHGKPGKLDKVIKKCIELEMIPMVELHDVTGKTTNEALMKMVEYFTSCDVKEVLIRYEKYLLLNIANEWGDHTTSSEYWRDTYMQAVDSLRKAGYKATIVIDASGWGQNLQPILDCGKGLLEYDPLHNILFSVHMYGSWNNPETIKSGLQKAYDAELPLIVGEFGYNYNNGENNLKCTVDQQIILETCNRLQYGYMPWSWSGNNEENAWLDLAESKNWKQLTVWGKSVFEGEHGITSTGKKASVFKD